VLTVLQHFDIYIYLIFRLLFGKTGLKLVL